ncbi:MAG: DHA2 family efflux MFS transporter permease subunit [Sphingomonadaceae bacterium]|nr:DHA2 family efflux MFS transporter permease subunit [Sphingomonadaceae bacterium]
MSNSAASDGGSPPRATLIGGQESDEPALPGTNHTLLIIGVMLASLLQVLDTTIANVAIPHMQSALGGTPESIMWVLTSYIIAAAIATPLTGWLSDRIGGRRLFIISIVTFVVASVLCGMAQNLEQMVFFRILQGLFGAFMAPLSQSFMLDSTRPSRHPTVMAIWSTGIMLGPIMGPLVGGWLTENWNWRFVFYVNLPLGLIALVLLLISLPERPKLPRRFDLFGFFWLSIGLASLQLLLDRGNHVDWFDSGEIWIYTGLLISATWITALHFTTSKNPLLNLSLFKDANFSVAMTLMIMLGAIMFSTMALLPPMLQHLQGYTVIGTGLVLMPRGIGSIISAQIGGLLMRRGVDMRIMMAVGLGVTSATLWQMTQWSLYIDTTLIATTSFIQGLAFGLVFIPINILAFATLHPSQRTEASSMLNLFRGVGSAVGISMVTVALARNMQISHSDLASHVTTASGTGVIDYGTIDRLQSLGEAAATIVDAEITRQAFMVAYINDFYMLFWIAVLTMPTLLFLKKPVLRA